ncbi:MAG: HPr family phosphocarrier protein [Gammaproteobacteria bacterium]|nr:HPr family phosphocarrier protein [Gammaproteobacteria bacterium]
MIQKKLTIENNLGLHARAAAKLVSCASRYGCKIDIIHNQRRVDGKSILGVMTLGARKGQELDIIIEGEEEQAAIDAIETLIKNRFGEDN